MKKISLLTVLAFLVSTAYTQDLGLSFSYFIPKNGYVSTPISPFSIRGLGVDLTQFLAIETGASLYRMSGLNMKDLPFESRSPLVGPNFTIFVPAELVLQLKSANVEFDIKGGAFGFYGFDHRLNYGNMDRAIREYEGWDVANSELKFKNHPGWGFHGGVEVTLYITPQLGISLESNYLSGDSKMPLKGSYSGGARGGQIVSETVDYRDAKIDFTGLEFSLGLIFSANGNGSGGGQKKGYQQRKRRR